MHFITQTDEFMLIEKKKKKHIEKRSTKTPYKNNALLAV